VTIDAPRRWRSPPEGHRRARDGETAFEPVGAGTKVTVLAFEIETAESKITLPFKKVTDDPDGKDAYSPVDRL